MSVHYFKMEAAAWYKDFCKNVPDRLKMIEKIQEFQKQNPESEAFSDVVSSADTFGATFTSFIENTAGYLYTNQRVRTIVRLSQSASIRLVTEMVESHWDLMLALTEKKLSKLEKPKLYLVKG